MDRRRFLSGMTAASIVAAMPCAQAKTGGPLRLAALGDSQTARLRLPPEERYLTTVRAETAGTAVLDDAHIFAGYGLSTDQIRAQWLPPCLAARPQMVLILAGGNDIGQRRPAADIIGDLAAMIEALGRQDAAVVIGTLLPKARPWPMDAARIRTMAEVNAWIARQASRQVGVADVHRDLRQPASPLGDPRFFKADGVHLSAAGCRVVGHRFAGAVSAMAGRLRG